jgi:diacylglycerol kinase family enzyme
VDGRGYLNVASVGLSVAVTRRLTPGLKQRLGPLAYPVAAVRAYRDQAPFSAQLEFPDGDHEPLTLDGLLQVAVGNGRHYGGGMTVSPTASLDDHLLDVYAIKRGRIRDHAAIARAFRDGTFVEHERVWHLTSRRVRLDTTPSLPINLDGEIATTTPATFTIERNALLVIIPRDSVAARLDGRSSPPGSADAGRGGSG